MAAKSRSHNKIRHKRPKDSDTGTDQELGITTAHQHNIIPTNHPNTHTNSCRTRANRTGRAPVVKL